MLPYNGDIVLLYPNHWEILLVLVIAIIIFGWWRNIPDLARSIGEGVTEFKKGLQEGKQSDEQMKNGSGSESDPEEEPSDSSRDEHDDSRRTD